MVAEHFEQELIINEAPLESLTGPPRPLPSPLTVDEIGAAAKFLENVLANGAHEVPNELLKCSLISFC